MPFDPVALAPHLHPSPAAWRMHLRGRPFWHLEALAERQGELPEAHRETLLTEIVYRRSRPWMHTGGSD